MRLLADNGEVLSSFFSGLSGHPQYAQVAKLQRSWYRQLLANLSDKAMKYVGLSPIVVHAQGGCSGGNAATRRTGSGSVIPIVLVTLRVEFPTVVNRSGRRRRS